MLRHLNDSFTLKTYSKRAFRGFILTCLRPQIINSEKDSINDISQSYIDRVHERDEVSSMRDLGVLIKGAAPQVRIQIPTEINTRDSDSDMSASSQPRGRPKEADLIYINKPFSSR